MALRVDVVCRNAQDDRIIPRMARALAQLPGWRLLAAPDPKTKADAVYLSAYFEAQRMRSRPDWGPAVPGAVPVAAYFTHKEEDPPGNDKAKLFDRAAKQVQLRVATCRMYAQMLEAYGPTIQAAAPLERERFRPPSHPSPASRGGRIVVGLSGFTYPNARKGEDLVRGVVESKVGRSVEWRASGRGWPVPTKKYSWEQMPAFYQGLDVLVCPSRVEGIPMPPLEALACGVSVVVPEHVGIFDELPKVAGIHRYKRGDLKSLVQALGKAVEARSHVDREALQGATAPYSVGSWCRDVAAGMEMLVTGGERVDGGLEEETAKAVTTNPTTNEDAE
ncbi:MAG TPA: glycosyltransferase, partial [Anaerolineales bacterium]|nr:glycosyltransferase [Anaerolineales bacterium]